MKLGNFGVFGAAGGVWIPVRGLGSSSSACTVFPSLVASYQMRKQRNVISMATDMYAFDTVGMLQANMKKCFRIKYKRKPIFTAISHILPDVLQSCNNFANVALYDFCQQSCAIAIDSVYACVRACTPYTLYVD